MEVVRCLGVVVVCLLVCFPQFLSSTKTQEVCFGFFFCFLFVCFVLFCFFLS